MCNSCIFFQFGESSDDAASVGGDQTAVAEGDSSTIPAPKRVRRSKSQGSKPVSQSATSADVELLEKVKEVNMDLNISFKIFRKKKQINLILLGIIF